MKAFVPRPLSFKAIALFLGFAAFTIACDDNNPIPPVGLQAVTVQNLIADTIIGITPGVPPAGGIPYGAGKFTFYSLETNSIIPSTDSASNRWDLGFRGTTIITNSGSSGPGQGGAFVWTGLFADLKSIPADSTFRVDAAPNYAIPVGSGRAWYTYSQAEQLVRPIPGKILVIRTSSGKFAKVEILNYYKGGVTPAVTEPDSVKYKLQRHYTFRYTFQPNGSRDF
ncbi:MAG: HmuY family protein [Bacteroidetes bacterium]|jgi:hypothetical protein|nr:HmuY family protein [Bacteroidota bacterium]